MMKRVVLAKTGVELNIDMTRAGSNARAELYDGEHDCLTFAKRKLHGTERNSAVSQSTQADDRSWAKQAEIASLKDGSNQIIIKELNPDTTYYYRVLVTNDEGRVWTFDTHQFKTNG